MGKEGLGCHFWRSGTNSGLGLSQGGVVCSDGRFTCGLVSDCNLRKVGRLGSVSST